MLRSPGIVFAGPGPGWRVSGPRSRRSFAALAFLRLRRAGADRVGSSIGCQSATRSSSGQKTLIVGDDLRRASSVRVRGLSKWWALSSRGGGGMHLIEWRPAMTESPLVKRLLLVRTARRGSVAPGHSCLDAPGRPDFGRACFGEEAAPSERSAADAAGTRRVGVLLVEHELIGVASRFRSPSVPKFRRRLAAFAGGFPTGD